MVDAPLVVKVDVEGIPQVVETLTSAARQVEALASVLADRERELLEIKGPCSNTRCRLHYAHSGPCDTDD